MQTPLPVSKIFFLSAFSLIPSLIRNVKAALAVAFKEANTETFRLYAANVVKNSKALAEHLLDKGFRIVTGTLLCANSSLCNSVL